MKHKQSGFLIRKIFKYLRRLALVGITGVTALLVSTPFYIYDQFNQEIPEARLTFEEKGDYNFTALLQQGDFCGSQQFKILGDQFQTPLPARQIVRQVQ